MTWTTNDERELITLRERVAEMERGRQISVERVEAIVQTFVSDDRFRRATVPELAEFLIARADQLRDALEPFDSGVRCSQDSGFGY